jgi:hypothetical protein
MGNVLEDKMNNPNYSIEDLLNEDEIAFQEIKQGNPKILNL